MLVYPEFTEFGEAPCASTDPDAFFPEPDEPGTADITKNAVKVCGDCPYQLECLAFALDNHEEYGIWGGKTPFERRKMLRQRAGLPVAIRPARTTQLKDYV